MRHNNANNNIEALLKSERIERINNISKFDDIENKFLQNECSLFLFIYYLM